MTIRVVFINAFVHQRLIFRLKGHIDLLKDNIELIPSRTPEDSTVELTVLLVVMAIDMFLFIFNIMD